MALHESALEELGLATRWVRRGSGQGAGVAPEQTAQRAETSAGGASDAALDSRPGAAPVAGRPLAHQAAPAKAAPAKAALQAVRDEQPSNAPQPSAGNASDVPEAALRAPLSQVRAEPAPQADTIRRAPAAEEPPASADDDFAWFDDLPTERPSSADATESVEARTNEPALPAVDTLDWPALEARVAGCEQCRLCEKRTNTVFGVGDREADWMLIGEAPGENEDRQGEPFVGQAGKLLDNMLRSLDLARGTNVYIANVIKCRPPGNRNPEADEVARCEPYLQRQVALVKPKLIVALGRFAAQSLLKTEASISSLRGRVHEYQGVPVVVTYHPAYLLRSLPDKAKSWQDLCLARDTLRDAGGTPTPSKTAG